GQSQSRDLLDALQTGLGKRVTPMLWVISTQAATDAMPMSQVIDYGLRIRRGELSDPTFHLGLYEAAPDADPWKLAAWRQATPGLGDILLPRTREAAGQAGEERTERRSEFSQSRAQPTRRDVEPVHSTVDMESMRRPG